MKRKLVLLLTLCALLCSPAIYAQETESQRKSGASERAPLSTLAHESSDLVWESITADSCGSTDVCCTDTPTGGHCCMWIFGEFIGCWKDY